MAKAKPKPKARKPVFRRGKPGMPLFAHVDCEAAAKADGFYISAVWVREVIAAVIASGLHLEPATKGRYVLIQRRENK